MWKLSEEEMKDAERLGERAADKDMKRIKKSSKERERWAIDLSESLIAKERSWKKTTKILKKIEHAEATRLIILEQMTHALMDGKTQAAVVLNYFKDPFTCSPDNFFINDSKALLTLACYRSVTEGVDIVVKKYRNKKGNK